jgi:hypothetical protein
MTHRSSEPTNTFSPVVSVSDVAVLRVGPERKIYVALNSILIYIHRSGNYLEIGQAMTQDVIAPRGRIQENTNSI